MSALQGEEELVFVEDLPDAPVVVAEQSHTISVLICIIVLLVLACLLLSQQLYLARRN